EQIDLVHREAGAKSLPVNLTLLEPMGADSLVWGDVAGTQFSVRIDGDAHVETPSRVEAFFQPAHASIFDLATGQRL
ncbi:MAG: ABC transporter ATP-binding protein, partial [Rhizobiales bacterium]|nr:ABC transporter ATP-binding protein [Hyphomicrobiales bacterium]